MFKFGKASSNKLNSKPKTKAELFFSDNLYIFLAFLCSAVIMLLVYYCYDMIPFGGCTILRMDLYHQYGPLFAEFYDRLTQFKSFLYSWNTGGGGAFLGNYYNYLSSPVGAIIALIAGHENIPEAIGVMVLVKNALASAILAFYLKKSLGKNDFSIAAFGVLYSFCGFFIAYYWNVMWIDAMYLLPLIVLGIESIIKKRQCKLYVASLAIAFFANYYMAYMICIFAVLYFIVYYISNCKVKDTYDDMPIYEDDDGTLYSRTIHKITYHKFLRSGFLFALSSLVSVGLVAFSLIPTYFCLKNCSATSGSFPTDMTLYNSIFDFLANHLASVEPTIRSSGDTVLPNVYCGILTVILIPIYAFCDKINAKERIAHIAFLAFFFVGFNVNYANYIFHALHFPNDLPFRFSFLYSFLLIIMAFKALTHIREVSAKAVIGSGLGVILFAVIVQKIGMSNVSDITIYISIGFAAVYTIVLGLMRKKEYAQSAVALLLMCCVFAEAAVSDTNHFQISQIKTNFTNGYSDFRNLKDSIDEKEGTDKYRLELTNINTLMDAAWFNYNGISVFSSMAYESSSNLQNQLGLDSNYINSYIYKSQTPVYNAMMSLKYLVNNDDTVMNEELFSFSAQCGKFAAYKNNYYLPIAYAVGKDVTNLSITSSDPFEIQSDYWKYATGIDGVFSYIPTSDYTLDNITEDDSDYSSNNFTFTKTDSDSDATITLNYVVPESQNVYAFLNSSSIDSINLYTDNGFSKEASIDEPFIIDCGYCEKDEVLTIEIPTSDSNSGHIECYVAGLDMDAFTKGYKILKDGEMNVTDFEETYIKGDVTLKKGQMLYTSINYDTGWSVKVDGVNTNITKIGDALIGVYVPEGEHTVEFSYQPQGLVIGIAVSAATVILLASYFIMMYILKNRNAETDAADSDDSENSNDSVENNTDIDAENSDDNTTETDSMTNEDLDENATVDDSEQTTQYDDTIINQSSTFEQTQDTE